MSVFRREVVLLNEDTNAEKVMSLAEAAEQIGIQKRVLKHHVINGTLEICDEKISMKSYTMIKEQKNRLISLNTFLIPYDNERFHSGIVSHRNKYVDFLEENRFFGLRVYEPEKILFEIPNNVEFYINREETEILAIKSIDFFREFGLTEEEKTEMIVRQDRTHPVARRQLSDYQAIMQGEGTITHSMTDFVRILFRIPDLPVLTDEDVAAAVEDSASMRTKEFLTGFFRYAAQREVVGYHDICLKKKETVGDTAYPYEIFVGLACLLFNEEYDRKHGLTEKALENHFYAEMWMFLSCHYVCGWRASDICDRWIYPCFDDRDNPFGINTETLKEDILSDSLSAQDYERVALYVIRRIDLANNVPQKTGYGKLRSEIVPELRRFFGKLILIAEHHHIQSGEGYMAAHRIPKYRSWIAGNEFFGKKYLEIFGRHHVQSRRLNKSYLQGIEEAAREDGNTVLTAHVVAAYARSHANVDTTAIYLRDHGLTGESADVVLYMMMQRGVFSISLYTTLLIAFPGAFEKLTAKEQTQIMEKIPVSAYELEAAAFSLPASDRMKDQFSQGYADEAGEILKAMFNLARGKGKSKDTGVWCMRRAQGYSCEKPTYASCIANICPYHIFTSEGVIPLVEVIKEYQKKALMTGNVKYRTALKKYIIPAFQEIIREVLGKMGGEEKRELHKLLEEVLNEPQAE